MKAIQEGHDVYILQSPSVCSDILCFIATIVVCATFLYTSTMQTEVTFPDGDIMTDTKTHALRALRGV